MDLDDIFPKKTTDPAAVGSDVSGLSIAELKDRIVALRSEVSRLEKELEARDDYRSTAEQAFKC